MAGTFADAEGRREVTAGLAVAVMAAAAAIGMLLGRRWRPAHEGAAASARGGRRAVEAGVRVLRTGVRRVRRRTLPRLRRTRRWRRRTLRPANRNALA